MSLPFVEEFEALEIMRHFQVDSLPLLQKLVKKNTALLEKCLLGSLDEYQVSAVSGVIKFCRKCVLQ